MTITRTTPKLSVNEAQWDQRNPSEINFLRPNGFRFLVEILPKVTYFVQSANIPDIDLGVAIQRTRFYDMPHPGDKLVYGPLTLKFIVQKDMADYQELRNWIVGLGFPTSSQDFIDFVGSQAYRFPVNSRHSENPQLSDATLLVLGSNEMPVAQFFYYDCFPSKLSGMVFNSTEDSSIQYIQATAEFQFRHFSFESLV